MIRPPSTYQTATGKLSQIYSESFLWVKQKDKTVLNYSVWTFLNLPWHSHFFREREKLGSIILSLCTYLKFLSCKLIQWKCVFPYHYHKYYCYGSLLPHFWKKAEWEVKIWCMLPASPTHHVKNTYHVVSHVNYMKTV